jgi:hypothetical protein
MPDAIQRLVDNNASLLRPLMEAVSAQRRQTLVGSPWLGQESSWQLPTTRRYLQTRHPPIAPTVQPDSGQNWIVEVARASVPFGSVGIIKSLEQYVADTDTIWTDSDHWGNPYPPFSIRWFFRLSPIAHVAAPWINTSGASALPDYLPGTSYDDLAESTGIWFSASSSASTNIHLPIPGGEVLRVVCIVGTHQSPVRIAAKLAGTVQAETNADAQHVVRTSW